MVQEVRVAGFPGWTAKAQGERRGTMVFLHGAFGDHTSFGPFLGFFSAHGYDGWAVARRGRLGVAPENAEGVTIEDYLTDTRRVLDEVGGKPILVGHSLGGLLALVLAAEGRAAAAVLVTPAPAGILTAQPVALPVYVPNLPKILLGRPFTVPAGGCQRIALNAVPDADERRRIHAQLVPESGLVYRALMLGTVKVDPEQVRCPVFVAAGEEDRIVSLALNRGTAARYHAELRVYPGRGHWLLEEPGWEERCGDVLGWLREVQAQAA